MVKKQVSVVLWIFFTLVIILGLPGALKWLDREGDYSDLNNLLTWGLWVALYVFFIGTSAGAFLISSLTYVFGIKRYEPIGKLSLFTALIMLFAALLFINADLGRPERAFNVLLHPNFSSVMVWVVYLYVFYTLILFSELWLLMRVDFLEGSKIPGLKGRLYGLFSLGTKDSSEASIERDHKIVRFLGTIGIVVATCFHGGVGALFAVNAARSFWHTGLFPITFLVSALLSGGALVACVAALFVRGGYFFRSVMQNLTKLVGCLLVFELLTLCSEFLVTLKGAIPSHVAVIKVITTGPFAWVFWGFQIGLGSVVPLLMIFGSSKPSMKRSAIACFLILVGIVGLRLNIVIPQLTSPPLRSFAETVMLSNMEAPTYVPSLMEWEVSFFIVGLAGFIFVTLYSLLPLLPGTLAEGVGQLRKIINMAEYKDYVIQKEV